VVPDSDSSSIIWAKVSRHIVFGQSTTVNKGMQMRSIPIVMLCILAAGSSISNAADSPSPLIPLEPYESLAFYEGSWASLAKDRAGVQEVCAWQPGGRRHSICKSRRPTPEGTRESLGVYSFDARRGEYVYHGFGARGGISFEHGQRIPGGCQFFSEEGAGADQTRTRFTIEESKAGGPWVVIEKVDYVRTRP
jgi:hypothetical protein